jgi:carbonic anhydrase/acetyltransferase-like protein (isoleucine patch superfamily)
MTKMQNNLFRFQRQYPQVETSAFIAPTATVIGDVTIAEDSSLWFGVVARGDVANIRIGASTNIQDNSVIHVTRNGFNTYIGDFVTIGHKCLIHASILEDECFVGMGSIVMDEARVETNGWLAAGSLLTSGKVVRSGEVWAGSPAKFFRKITPEEQKFIKISAQNYVDLAKKYQENIAHSH